MLKRITYSELPYQINWDDFDSQPLNNQRLTLIVDLAGAPASEPEVYMPLTTNSKSKFVSMFIGVENIATPNTFLRVRPSAGETINQSAEGLSVGGSRGYDVVNLVTVLAGQWTAFKPV